MTERVLGWVGRASAILLAIGLAMLVARPDWPIGSTLVHAGVAALMTADAHDMEPGQPTLVGASAVQEGLMGLFQQNSAQIEITGEKTDVSGDMAYDRGTYRNTITPKAGGAAMTEEGRYLVVLKRQADGSWKLVELMGNVPTAPAAAPAP